MTGAEKRKLTETIKATDREQAAVIAAALPLDILYEELSNKISAMNDFITEFSKLRESKIFKELGYEQTDYYYDD